MIRPPHCLDISVIIPSFNSGEGITKCLEALCRQTVPRSAYEIIVVDDGSLDDSNALARRFEAKVVHQDHAGPAAARNNGVEHSSGDLLLFTDSDCVPRADWIEKMVMPFKESDVMGVKGVYQTRQRGLVARFVQSEFEEKYDRLRKVSRIDFIDTYSAGYRRSVFLENGGFDVSYPGTSAEDVEFCFRLSQKGNRFVFASEAVVFHTHPSSLWRYLVRKLRFGMWRAKVYVHFPGKMVKDSYTPRTVHAQILLSSLLALSVLVGMFEPAALLVTLSLALAFLLSTLPFLIGTFKRDRVVGLISPPLLFLRCMAQCLGLAAGALQFGLFSQERRKLFSRLLRRDADFYV